MVAGGDAGAAVYDVALKRRQNMMGASGPMALVKNFKVFRIALFACIGGILYGYNQGMFSGVLAMPAFKARKYFSFLAIYTDLLFDSDLMTPANHKKQNGTDMGEYDPFDDAADQTKKGWLTAILELGAWVGTLLSGFIAEAISRKYAVLVSVTVFIIGVVIQATAQTGGHDVILGGRFVTGMGVGALATIVPIYNSEVAPPEIRGALVALQQLAITFGIMVSFWIDYGTNYIGGVTLGTQTDAAWLVPTCLQLFPAAVLFVGMIFMPFSPRWLVHHDREDEARKILASLRGLSPDHELVELEFLEIKAQSRFEKRTVAELFPNLSEQTAWNTFKLQFVAIKSLFQTKAMFKRVVVATVTMFFDQWTGINAILYYSPTIFKQLGMDDNVTSLLATGVVGIVMFLATIPAVLYIDRVGRKPILIIGALGMATCHIIIAVIVAKNASQWATQQAAGWAAVAMVWLFVIHFGYSWGPCAWIIVAEIWPLSTRPYGTSLGASSNWMNNFSTSHIFHPLYTCNPPLHRTN